jgi:beta-alanine--pyruvate transaminase
MGGVMVRKGIYDAFMQGPENMIELFHGYTYSAHPLACAAGLASLEIYREEELFDRAQAMAPYWEEALHSLKDAPNVIDIRNIGLMGAVELAPRQGKPGARGFDAFLAVYEAGALVRLTGDTLAMSPPLIIEREQVDQLVDIIGGVLRRLE